MHMTNTTQDTQQKTAEAKRLILSGFSYAKAAKQVGLDSLTLLNRLRDDKDILAAKAAGLLNKPRNTARRVKYAELPVVIDVLQNSLTQAEAAEKHKVSQPYISRCVRKAREELAQAAPIAKTEAPTNANDAVPSADPEIDAIKALLAAYAARHQIDYEQARNLLSAFSAQYQQQDKP